MDNPVERVEFEATLFGRYTLAARRSRGGALDRGTYTLLARVSVGGPMSIGQLSDALGLDVSTLNRRTAAAVRDGQLERIEDPEGGVARKFRLTEHGAARLAEERGSRLGYLGTILGDWDEGDIAAFADLLRRFNVDIERHHGAAWPRPGEVGAVAGSVPVERI